MWFQTGPALVASSLYAEKETRTMSEPKGPNRKFLLNQRMTQMLAGDPPDRRHARDRTKTGQIFRDRGNDGQ